jgi:hypothetical protein
MHEALNGHQGIEVQKSEPRFHVLLSDGVPGMEQSWPRLGLVRPSTEPLQS